MIRRLVAIVLSVSLVSGCGWVDAVAGDIPDYNVPLTLAQVPGTWRNQQFGGAITFAADGTFTATDVPYEAYLWARPSMAPGFDGPNAHLKERGTWTLEAGDSSGRLTSVRIAATGNATFPRGFNAVLHSWREKDGSGSLLLEVADAPRFDDVYTYLRTP